MKNKLTCDDCKHSDRVPRGAVIVQICRYLPPLVAYQFVPHAGGEGAEVLQHTVWPLLEPGDYCDKLQPGIVTTHG